MNPSFFIAKRYFFQESLLWSLLACLGALLTLNLSNTRFHWQLVRSQLSRLNFIQWLSGLAMIGLCLGTAALIVVMSVFNGLEGLTKELFKNYNPELKVTPPTGKVFAFSEELKRKIERVPGIETVSKVLEDQVLLRYAEKQKVIYLKGIDDNYFNVCALDTCVKVGTPNLWREKYPQTLIGSGIQYELSINVRSPYEPVQFWYPKREMKFSLNPERAFEKKAILPAGAFIVDPDFDSRYALVPYTFAAELMQRDSGMVSELAIKTTGTVPYETTKKGIRQVLGEEFLVETLEEQQAGILKAIQVERLFVAVAMVFILGIVAFNVFYSLAMLTIEKKRDIAVLRAMGGGKKFIRNIFLLEGTLIGLQGTFSGLLLGFTICAIQVQFGIIKLGGRSTIVDSYPVEMQWGDFLFAGMAALSVTIFASIPPARKAAKKEVLTDLG